MAQSSDTHPAFEAITDQMETIATELDLDKPTKQSATVLVKELNQHDICVTSPHRTAAACLLFACRLRENPVRVTVLATQTSATKAMILNEMKRLSTELDIRIPLDNPKAIIEKTCRELALPVTVEERAKRLADLGNDADVTSGVSPYTYAAAVIYIVCSPRDVEISQTDIAVHLDVATATLRNRRDDLLEATGSQLFKIQFSNAPAEAVTLVDDLLGEARTADWATNKRFLGIFGGAWLYAARTHDIQTTAADLAALTGISESTIHARYKQFVDHVDTTPTTPAQSDTS